MKEYEVVLHGGHYFEAPRWHDGRLWVSDFHAHKVYSVGLDRTVRTEAEVPNRPSGLGWLPDGRLLIVSMLDQKVLRRERDGQLTEHADLSSFTGGALINDMLVDQYGNAFIGSVGFRHGDPVAPAPLLHVAPDGASTVAARDLWMPNGMAMLRGPVLLVGESLGNRHTAFDVGEDGSVSNRRVWASYGAPRTGFSNLPDLIADTKDTDVGSDGCAADAAEALWVADAHNDRIIRVEAGRIVEEIQMAELSRPDMTPIALALGGDDGRTLFICVAPDFDAVARSVAREAQVLSIRVEVPGIDFA